MMRLLLPAILLALACPAGAGGTSADAVRATGFVPSVGGRPHHRAAQSASLRGGLLCANGYTVADSWCLGLDPTDETSDISASLTFTNGAPCVTVSPSTDRCDYEVQGRAELAGGDWEAARYDGTHKFFRVSAKPKELR